MALKTIDQQPLTTDTILFDLPTPGADGCFTSDPYKVDSLVVYYVERSFLGSNYGTYDSVKYDPTLLAAVTAADKLVCDNPSQVNITASQLAHARLQGAAQTNTFYFKEAVPVLIVGDAQNSAWLSTGTANALLIHNGTGRFQYQWQLAGDIREGDFFVCWTWTPLIAGDSLSNNQQFTIFSDPRSVVTIPSHIVSDTKYDTLLERYLPEMYKETIADIDLTPDVTDKLNHAIAKGFTFIENQANQVIDLFDANALHESFLVYLADLFNLKLKSQDPTLWRRQIKEAIPLFKQKGTENGLKAAFAQAGMTLNKVTNLWQVVSPYTWQESFLVKDSAIFQIAKPIITPIDPNNFGLWVRRAGTSNYVSYNHSMVSFTESDCGLTTTMTWIGDESSVNPVHLFSGDIIRVLYQFRTVPGGQQSIENYIRALSLADLRDEAAQEFPFKNWNVHLIEEDDPLFSSIVPVRQPFTDAVIFGKVRTEFPYGENIYNMEEYNGSVRDSTDPCEIDKDFVDPCTACFSSKFSIDLSIEDLCDDRVAEVYDILSEYTPFHAVPQQINLAGEVNDFVQPPVEEIEVLIQFNHSEFVLSGDANPFFTRYIEPNGLTTGAVTRSQLADMTVVVSNKTGVAYNDHISLVSPGTNLQDLGINKNEHILEVLAPSANAATYRLTGFQNEVAQVIGVVNEPLDQSMFTFNLSNILYATTTASITQSDLFMFTDSNTNLADLGVKTNWDVLNTPNYTGGAWSVRIPSLSGTPYVIDDIQDGVLILVNHSNTLPTGGASGLTYSLLDDNSVVVAQSTTGVLTVTRRGLVDLHDIYIMDIHQFVQQGDYVLYSGIQFPVSRISGSKFYIDNYQSGNAAGVTLSMIRRLAYHSIGYFAYSGLKLRTTDNYEDSLGMLNGDNPPTTDPDQITDNSLFKECFLVQIGNDFYKIAEINSTLITLDGLPYDWTTLMAGGTSVQYNILHFTKDTVAINLLVFDQLGRGGKDPVIQEIQSLVNNDIAIVALQVPKGADLSENVAQEEQISFKVEYRNGQIQEGVL